MQKNKKIIFMTGGLCAIFAITFTAVHFIPTKDANGWKHYAAITAENKEKDDNDSRSYALVHIDKNTWTGISAHDFIRSVSSILEAYREKNYTTFLFDDGTGLMFPGSDISETAFYGKTNNNGNIISPEKYITISGQDVTSSDVPTFLSEDSMSLYSVIPDEYNNDSTYACLSDGKAVIKVVVADEISTIDVANTIYNNLMQSGIAYSELDICVNEDNFMLDPASNTLNQVSE